MLRRRGRAATRRGRANLIADFGDADLANFVQHTDDIAMHGHRFRANRDLNVGISLMKLKEARRELVLLSVLTIEVIDTAGADADGDKILYLIRRGQTLRRQVYLDAFHMHLAQAHHHEAGEEKEHDVDQRDDLDARFLVRDG